MIDQFIWKKQRCVVYLLDQVETKKSLSCPLTTLHGQACINSLPFLVKKILAISTYAVQGSTPLIQLLTQIAAWTSASQQPDIFLLISTPVSNIQTTTVARGIALYGGFGEVPNVGSRKCKKPKTFMAFEGLRHHLNVF
jgi:hypothetical protein